MDSLALERTVNLAGQHERYRDLTKCNARFEAVGPAFPPDFTGIYVFIPGGVWSFIID